MRRSAKTDPGRAPAANVVCLGSADRAVRMEEKLRALTFELIMVEERERQRIAASLHDHVAQELAAAKLKCESFDPASHADCLREIQDILIRCIRVTRSLMNELSPPVLYELGFAQAIEWLADQFQSKYNIPAEFENRLDLDDMQPLAYELKVFLFQATRELLTNVARHAGARRVKVILSGGPNEAGIEVADNGSGFDVPDEDFPAEMRSGFGLFGIRERLKHFGGRLDIQSRPGRGTRVTIIVPSGK